jgi:hypothetical protein
MVLYAYFLWLAALAAMGCGPDGDEMHRLMLGLTPFACGFALTLRRRYLQCAAPSLVSR